MRKIAFILVISVAIGFFPKEKDNVLTATPSVSYKRMGKASWYSRRSPGIKKRTASNELFNDQDMTCAMWGVEFGREVKVTNLENGKSVVVRVNDRGPSEEYIRKGRVVDLTKKAFQELGGTKKGLLKVELDFL